jgi:hypothetical protein
MSELNVIFQGFVINNQDPLMLGRIRAVPINQTESALLPQDWNPEKDIWTQKDPLIFLPLLPYYVSQVPRVDEYIHIFYYNTSQVVDNTKFYIQGPITRPQNNFFENWHNSESMLATGPFLKQANNIKDPLTFEIKGDAKGIYPEPGDNAILGRGTSDIIVKENEVLIRAGKNVPTQTANFNIPTPKQNRSFLQLSSYPKELQKKPPVTKELEVQKTLLVKNLVEWQITSAITTTALTINNTVTAYTVYDGFVSLYSLIPNEEVKTSNIQMNSYLEPYKGSELYTINFSSLTLYDGSKLINQFITGVNKGKITIDGYPQYPYNTDGKLENQFPFYFRPTRNNVEKLSSSGTTSFNMVNDFFRRIKLLPSDVLFGSVLVWSQNRVGQQLSKQEVTLQETIYKSNSVSYGALTSDILYLLSHKSQIPSRQKINLLPKETLYGMSQQYFIDNVSPNTEPMVRGYQLMELLNQMVEFMMGHVHNINEAPIPVTKAEGGVDIRKIKALVNNADQTILNQYIRIN